MSLTLEERIIRLRRGIASKETPATLKKVMESDLEELLKPKEEPAPYIHPVKEKKPPVKKAVKVAPITETKAPEPPQLTAEDKARLKEEYARKAAKKREKEED